VADIDMTHLLGKETGDCCARLLKDSSISYACEKHAGDSAITVRA
jgi:hypothetical protein